MPESPTMLEPLGKFARESGRRLWLWLKGRGKEQGGDHQHWKLAESAFLWGALGMIAGSAVSLDGVYFLGWELLLAWAAICIACIRHLFAHKTYGHRIAANIVVIPLVAWGVYGLRKAIVYHMPRSSPPASAEAIAKEICKQSPGLCLFPAEHESNIHESKTQIATPTACSIRISTTTDPFARWYDFIPFNNTDRIRFSFQELFVEWKATVSVTQKTSLLTVKVNRILQGDSISMKPSEAERMPLVPEWMSGFKEEGHPDPDYFSQLITFHDLAKNDAIEIAVRRRFTAPVVGSSELPIVEEARTENCSAKISIPDQTKESQDLTQRLIAVSKYPNGNAPLPLGNDPGVPPGQYEATIQVRCQNAKCDRAIMSNLEVRKGNQ